MLWGYIVQNRVPEAKTGDVQYTRAVYQTDLAKGIYSTRGE